MAEEIKLILSADDDGLQASFARARAAVGSYEKRVEQSRQAALRSALGQEEVLKLQAAGHTKQAAALEQEIRLHDEARKLAERSGITEQKAVAILERRAALQRQIAASQGQMAMTGPGRPGLPLAELTPKALNDLERAKLLNQQVGKSVEQAGKSARNSSMGFLAFSQAVEDSQYGVNGILNNIPMMVMGFGGSMGLAGAISLAAVAATQGFRLLKRFTGEAASMAWEAARVVAAQTYQEELRKIEKDLRNTARAEKVLGDVTKERLKQLEMIQQAVGVNEARAKAMAAEVDLVRDLRNEEDMLHAARARFQKSGGSDWQQAAMKFYREQARFEQDLAAKQKEKVAVGRELNLVWENIGRGVSGYTYAVGVAKEAVDTLAGRVAIQQAEEARSMENLKAQKSNWTAATRRAEEQNLASIRKRLEENQALLREAEAELALQKELLETTTATGEQSKKTLQDRISGLTKEMDALERKKKLSLEIARIEAESLRMDALREASQRGLEIAREAAEKAASDAEEKARRDKGRVDFAGEMVALQLEAAGRKEQADALRKELEMRAGAVDLAKSLGVTEAEALRMLREKERLMRTIAGEAERAGGGRGGRIEARGRGAFLRGDLGGSPGLRNAAMDERSRERAVMARPGDRAASFYERQLNLTEEMLKVFQRLGAY